MKTSFPSDFLNSFRLPSYNNGFFVLCEILVITFATQSYVEFCFTINLHCLQKHLSFDFCAPQMRDQTLPVPPKKRQTILNRVIINSTASLTISSNFSHGLLRLMFVLRFGQKRKQINYCLVFTLMGMRMMMASATTTIAIEATTTSKRHNFDFSQIVSQSVIQLVGR